LFSFLRYRGFTKETSKKRAGRIATLRFSRTAVFHAVSGDVTKVVKADVFASNGVIHVIDTVLLPKD
jgi:uncharacterized surface protein with fasciclin (FAS1) repeats